MPQPALLGDTCCCSCEILGAGLTPVLLSPCSEDLALLSQHSRLLSAATGRDTPSSWHPSWLGTLPSGLPGPLPPEHRGPHTPRCVLGARGAALAPTGCSSSASAQVLQGPYGSCWTLVFPDRAPRPENGFPYCHVGLTGTPVSSRDLSLQGLPCPELLPCPCGVFSSKPRPVPPWTFSPSPHTVSLVTSAMPPSVTTSL